jgi:hypothetical protein
LETTGFYAQVSGFARKIKIKNEIARENGVESADITTKIMGLTGNQSPLFM